MCPVPSLGLKFVKITSLHASDLDGNADSSRDGVLYDLFVPDTAPNCPHPLVRNRPDGHSTGDLFEEVEPGFYAFRMSIVPMSVCYSLMRVSSRGRNDDWIRTGPQFLFCDTKWVIISYDPSMDSSFKSMLLDLSKTTSW